MKPCNNVIVTVKFMENEIDMELPAFLSLGEICRKLEETFSVMFPERAGTFEIEALVSNGKRLPNNKNLASAGIWDGSILNCSLRRGA